LVDTAAEQARHAGEVAQDTVRRAADAADSLPATVPLAAAAVKVTRERRRARKRRERRAARAAAARDVARRGRGRPVVILLVIGGIVAAVVLMRRRAATNGYGAQPAPDPFGAAVEAEREAMGNGAQRPVATPGA
jgi:hypothetical protein